MKYYLIEGRLEDIVFDEDFKKDLESHVDYQENGIKSEFILFTGMEKDGNEIIIAKIQEDHEEVLNYFLENDPLVLKDFITYEKREFTILSASEYIKDWVI